MKLTKIHQIEHFLSAVNKCRGDVWLTSNQGDKFNLRSRLSQYVAIGALLGEYGDELELWCALQEDEEFFFDFFQKNPEVLNG